MKLLFLRGFLPHDRPISEIVHDSFEEEEDMWTFLANALGDERCDIVYIGGKRHVAYSEKCHVHWFKDIDSIKLDSAPDVIFARGGFGDWVRVVERRDFVRAKRVYYGAGQRIIPEKGEWDFVLCDTQAQFDKLKSKGFNPVLWVKPCAPHFRPMNVPKEFDVCYVGDGRYPFRAKIKRVGWFYKTLPGDLKALHLGWSGNLKPPKNVTVRRVERKDMPTEYSRCKVLVCCYKDYDSAPRVIPEALACGVPVVAMDSLNFNNLNNVVAVANKESFWDTVRGSIEKKPEPYPNVYVAAEMIRRVINGEG